MKITMDGTKPAGTSNGTPDTIPSQFYMEKEAPMTSQTDRKDEAGTGMTYEEYIHSRLPEIEEAEAKSRYGSLPRRRRHCYEVFPCPRQAAHDSLLKERDELKREVERLNRELWKEIDRGVKAEAEAKELREELGRSRGLREAAMEPNVDNPEYLHSPLAPGTKQVLRAVLAYRAAKEGAK